MRSGATEFTFAGVNGKIYNIANVNNASSGGLFRENFIGSRNIREDKIEGRPAPYFYGVEELPMSFAVTFAMLGDLVMDANTVDEITDWLIQDEYQPLIFADEPSKVYWVIFDGNPSFIHNGVYSGRFTLNARCLYPYPVTEEIVTPLMAITTSGTLSLTNPGKKSVIPNMVITIAASGNNTISFHNNDNNSDFEITGDYGDEITVDGYNRIVTNETQGVQIKPSKRWLVLDKGVNDIDITGDCTLEITYRSGLYS